MDVTVHYLIASNSDDEKRYKSIQQMRTDMTTILGDDYKRVVTA